jgi:hypothetical protein
MMIRLYLPGSWRMKWFTTNRKYQFLRRYWTRCVVMRMLVLLVCDLVRVQIQNRYQLTGTKEIKKVAEARARKRKRALQRLAKAKKQANTLAEVSCL